MNTIHHKENLGWGNACRVVFCAGALLGCGALSLADETPDCVSPPHSATCINAELAEDLARWAGKLSGLPFFALQELPPLLPLPQEALAQEVCGLEQAHCRGLVAVYDTDLRRILYVNTLDMSDPTDQSFIVHELVHALQHQQRGDALHASCAAVVESEREAYAVQNRYLAEFRQWRRVGKAVRFMHCADETAAVEPTLQFQGAMAVLAPLH